MTDEPESPEVAEVRRLLAEARHTEPMPDDVAARLDDVLAGLARPTSAEPTADVVPLAARRRRQAAGWLLAAAAVVVGAVVVVPHLPGRSAPSPAAGSQAEDSALGNTGNTGNTGETGGKGNQPTHPQSSESSGVVPLAGKPVVVRPRHFTADALSTRRRLTHALSAYGDAKAVLACAGVPGGQHSVAAEYRNSPAALVYLRPQGGSQTVYLYLCGRGQPIRSATLPVP